MEQVIDNSKNNSYLNCSICFEQLEEPLRISCNHTFCKKCLLAWMRPGNRTCPMCRRDIDLLMVDTIEDILEEAHSDFASRLAIEDVIVKRSIIRRPLIISSNEFDYMLFEDHYNLGHGRLTRLFVILYFILLKVFWYVWSPPFRLVSVVFVGLLYLALFCILYYDPESVGRISD